MNWFNLALVMLLGAGSVYAQAPVVAPAAPAPMTKAPVNQPMPQALPQTAPAAPAVSPIVDPHLWPSTPCQPECCSERAMFQSDHEFDGFVGPITNPILSKDPRSNTYIRFLFIHNSFPGSNPVLRGGSAQVFAAQANVAITERLSIIADKDGYATINANGLPNADGWLNINAGLKYTFWRDVENQRLAAIGFMYEPVTGEARPFQRVGNGLFTTFVTFGQEFGCGNHFLGTVGYQTGVDSDDNSSLFYTSLHLDRQVMGWLYPLVELNWFKYTNSGNNFPSVLGEGDGLLNFGTRDIAGRDIVTGAVGLKAVFSQNVIAGVAYEVPFTQTRDIINNRLTAELILRY